MQNFAVLLTCFNRKAKTLAALTSLYKSYEYYSGNCTMSVYLTDDGSTDGTRKAVSEQFPKVNILQGSGDLYWAGGMRHTWAAALKGNYDAYLLLNDDTNVRQELFEQIEKTAAYCLHNFQQKGILIGATIDVNTQKVSYGGSLFNNRFLATMRLLPISDKPQQCELGNANIMWVPNTVVDKIGMLSEGYIHGMADYDYTLKALKHKIPALVLPGILGECINDHSDPYLKLMKLSFKDRIKMLYNPVGLDFSSQVHHMKKHFPLRFPIFYVAGWFKVVFPKVYYNLIYKNRMDLENS
ncbi:MAG: glycosyltransferase [Cellulophaga sp.]|nr:glycosyltransferase [Cellulophaga sp.]